MSFRPDHDLHRRRFGRNLGLGLTLVGFVVLIFALTVVKVTETGPIQGYDHVLQPGLVPPPEAVE